MRWPFKEWGADAVLSGYYHVYERLLVNGLPYFINGAGGTWTSFFGETDAHSQFRYREDFGALLIDASDARITFRFVSRAGRIIDGCLLPKTDSGKKIAGESARSGLAVQPVSGVRCDKPYG